MGILPRRRTRAEGGTAIRRTASLLVIALLALVACDRGDDGNPDAAPGFTNAPTVSEPPPVTTVEPELTASATPPAVTDNPPPTSGDPSSTCVNGWVTPAEGTTERTNPIGVIRRTARFAGDYEIVDMRLFVGPESPPSDKGYLADIRRWYVKLYAVDDPAYQGRFLVEQRRFGRGVAAVAPYDSDGFRSPDWIGFQWETGAEPQRYDGLPGTWAGIPYDFVEGGAGLTIPGLPDEVRGCLDGT
jgi:hypothetical protein